MSPQSEATLHTVEAFNVPDCGNAPRRAIIRDFVLALYEKNVEHLSNILSDRIEWHVVGAASLRGPDAVVSWVQQSEVVNRLEFHTILTHGREGGADGEIRTVDGKVFGFAHVFLFAGAAKTAKLTLVRSYLVPIA